MESSIIEKVLCAKGFAFFLLEYPLFKAYLGLEFLCYGGIDIAIQKIRV